MVVATRWERKNKREQIRDWLPGICHLFRTKSENNGEKKAYDDVMLLSTDKTGESPAQRDGMASALNDCNARDFILSCIISFCRVPKTGFSKMSLLNEFSRTFVLSPPSSHHLIHDWNPVRYSKGRLRHAHFYGIQIRQPNK